MKALFIGKPLHDTVRDVFVIQPKYRHRRTGAGDAVYYSQSIAQVSTGKRWLVYVRGDMPPADEVFAMIQAHNLPTIEEQRNAG